MSAADPKLPGPAALVRELDAWSDRHGHLEEVRRRIRATPVRPRRLRGRSLVLGLALLVPAVALAWWSARHRPAPVGGGRGEVSVGKAEHAPRLGPPGRNTGGRTPVPTASAIAAAPDPDLIGHWQFDDADWLLDSSGNGNHAVLPRFRGTARRVPGVRGHALGLKGEAFAHVAASATLDSIDRAFTLAAWIFRTEDGLTFDTVASRQRAGENGEHFGLGCFDNQLTLLVETTPPEITARDWGLVPIHRWVHVAGVYDGQAAILYLNGAEVARAAKATTVTPDGTPLLIGANQNASGTISEFFEGHIDDVRIYRRSLGAEEIAALATDPRSDDTR